VHPRPELPGPLAIAVSRTALKAEMSRIAYSVCEKSDGDRHLLLVLPNTVHGHGKVLLVDRSFRFWQLQGALPSLRRPVGDSFAERSVGCVMADEIARGGPTLLDGELIDRPVVDGLPVTVGGPTKVFLVFDAIHVNGRRTADEKLLQRLRYIGESVRLPLREDERRRRERGLQLVPLLCLGKTFRPASELLSIWGMVRDCDASTIHGVPLASPTTRVYVDGERVNLNDGLVFTPNEGGYLDLLRGTNPRTGASPLFKWKPLHDNTVDFVIRRSDLTAVAEPSPVTLWIGDYGHKLSPVARCDVTPEKALELLAAVPKDEVVVECCVVAADWTLVRAAFERREFFPSWEIVKLRADKARPNFIKTAWSTLEVLSENVQPEEIVRVVKKP
jgi:hypothetical protein